MERRLLQRRWLLYHLYAANLSSLCSARCLEQKLISNSKTQSIDVKVIFIRHNIDHFKYLIIKMKINLYRKKFKAAVGLLLFKTPRPPLDLWHKNPIFSTSAGVSTTNRVITVSNPYPALSSDWTRPLRNFPKGEGRVGRMIGTKCTKILRIPCRRFFCSYTFLNFRMSTCRPTYSETLPTPLHFGKCTDKDRHSDRICWNNSKTIKTFY